MMEIRHEKNNYNASITEDSFLVAHAGFYAKSNMDEMLMEEPVSECGGGLFLLVNLDSEKLNCEGWDTRKDYAEKISCMVYEMLMREE